MKNILLVAVAMLVSGSVLAGTDHYLLREGSHVHHLKITTLNEDIYVSSDVDFEPNTTEAGSHSCSADIKGEAKRVADNELLLKKHSESDATYCELKIHLSPTGAKIEQSKDCDNFAAGICHFSSDDKELLKIK